PYSNRSIVASGREPLAVGTPRHGEDQAAVTPQPERLALSGSVPNAERAPRTPGSDIPSVRAPGCLEYAFWVTSQCDEVAVAQAVQVVPLPAAEIGLSSLPIEEPLAHACQASGQDHRLASQIHLPDVEVLAQFPALFLSPQPQGRLSSLELDS